MVTFRMRNDVVILIAYLLNPLQGAFNCLIYLIPVFRGKLKARRQNRKLLKKEKTKDEEMTKKNVNAPHSIPPSSSPSRKVPYNKCNSKRTSGYKDSRPAALEEEEEKEEEREQEGVSLYQVMNGA